MSDAPPKKASFLRPIGFLLICGLLYAWFFATERAVAARTLSADSLRAGFCHKVSMATYLPEVVQIGGAVPYGRFFIAYLPAALLISAVIGAVLLFLHSLLIVKPTGSLIVDPVYDVQHKGVDTPRLSHLRDVLRVCPKGNYDAKRLEADILENDIDINAPEAKGVEMTDDPSQGKSGKNTKRK